MRKILLVIILCTPLLSSCWDRTELQDLSIITAAAIDVTEDEKIRISAQIFIPRSITSGTTGEDPSLGSTFVREGVGDSLGGAIAMLQVNVPRRLFWGQCKIFIFGEKLAENGIRKEIDYLVRHPEPRGGSYLYVSEGEGKKILTLIPPLERYSGEVLRKLTKDEIGMVTNVRDVDMDLMEEGESTSMPLIKELVSKEKTRKPHETIPVISGTAIFKKDKMVNTLNLSETFGLIWLKKKVRNSTFSVKPEGENGEITMTPTLGSVKFHPKIANGKWIMNLKVSVEGDTVQNETHLNLMDEDVIKKIEAGYEAVIKESLTKTIEKLQQQSKTDIIGFGRRFHQRYPNEWKKVKSNWDEKFSEVKVNIEVDATIRRPGFIGPPAALPQDEVKES